MGSKGWSVLLLPGLVYGQTVAVAEISSYVRTSSYVSAEEGEEEGEAKIAIFFPGISLKNKTRNLSLYQLALQRISLKMKGVKRLPGRVPETVTPGSVNCSLHSQRLLTKAWSI